MQTDTPSTPTAQDRARKLEAELIFGDQADADAAGIALRLHGYAVVPRPDWDNRILERRRELLGDVS